MLTIPSYETRSFITLSDAVAVVQNLTINSNTRLSESIEDGAVVATQSTSGHINYRAAVYASQSAFEQGAEPVEYFQSADGVEYFNQSIDEEKTGREQAYDHLLGLDTFNNSTLTEGVAY